MKKYGSDKKMKDDMNPKRMKKAYGGSGGMPTTERKKANMGRMMYKDGGMPKAKPC